MAQGLSEFQIETRFREIAQSTLEPFIARMEKQLADSVTRTSQSQSLTKQVSILTSNYKLLMQTLDHVRLELKQINSANIQRNSEVEQMREEHEIFKTNVQSRMDDLNRHLVLRTRQLNQLVEKHEQSAGRLENFKSETSNSTLNIHNKITEGFGGCLTQISKLKMENQRTQKKEAELELIISSWKETSKSNFQNLQLYLSEREEIKQRLAFLESKLQILPNNKQFQDFKKYQGIELRATVQRLTRYIDSALPPKVVQHLPSLCHFSMKLESIKEQQRSCILTLEQTFKDFSAKIRGQMEFQQQRMRQEINEQFQTVIKERQKQIYHAVMSLIPKEEMENYQNLKKQMPAIQKIKSQLEVRSGQIMRFGDQLTETMNSMSHRMTKMKTDLQLRSSTLETDVRYLQKNREKVDQKFSTVGRVLSFYMEMLNILTSCSVSAEATLARKEEQQIFATLSDGIMCQVKQLPFDLVSYRKRTVRRYDLLQSTMFSLGRFLDEMFKEGFLGWSSHKPSDASKGFILEQVTPPLRIELNHNSKRPFNRMAETPEPKLGFKQASESVKQPSMSISLQHLDIFEPKRKEKKPPANRYEEFVSKTARIRSRNLSRKGHY